MTVLALTARIVTAHVGHNPVAPDALPGLIKSVFHALNGLGTDAAPATPAPAPVPALAQPILPPPAVDPRQSVFDDYIICLEDGKHQKTLKRHLHSAHGLTPDAYRARWDLGPTYPMVAPAYAEHRSELAKRSGLGTRRDRTE